MITYQDYPPFVVEDIVRIRRRIAGSQVPQKRLDDNLLIATWNLRGFGRVYPQWQENPADPKRNLRAMACIAEIIQIFDVIAVQEIKADTTALRMLVNDFLGHDWGLVISDVTAGQRGNTERLGFIYDRRRVQPSGLAGEIVLPPTPAGIPEQFDRTPYIVGFQAGGERFSLLTTHIRYGDAPADRLPELQAFARFTADEILRRSGAEGEEANLIVLGDFNIDERGSNPLFQAFVATGLTVPPALLGLRTTYNTKAKYYDQIAWFMGGMNMLASGRAGVVDFAGAIFKELSLLQMTYRVSDHFPLWVEFITDRSTESMAQTLGVDPAMPNAFGGVPD